ncbi:MAG: phosphoribosylanthranilate isomerase [Pseudomonadota bacterium]
MAHTRTKICGITRVGDARSAIDAGADALGLVFYEPSPRAVDLETARKIVDVVPPFVTTVALFVDAAPDVVRHVTGELAVDLLQFHGDESPDYCDGFGTPYIKALRMRPEMDIVATCERYAGARGVLLDSWQAGVPGGTGKTFDWAMADVELPLPLVLAGGLHAGNVIEAMARLRPAAVDVSGGVESAPGLKDERKILEFIAAVRAADNQA